MPTAAHYTNHQAMVADGICDAVVVASPNMTHVDVLRDLLATDLHILIEKPLCTTVDDCYTVLELAEGRNAVTWVGLEYRYMPPIARLIDEVANGAVGTPKMISIREHRFPFLEKVGDWNRFSANTGGTLVEKTCHFFDLMCHIMPGTPSGSLPPVLKTSTTSTRSTTARCQTSSITPSSSSTSTMAAAACSTCACSLRQRRTRKC